VYFTSTTASDSINSVRCRQLRHHTRLLSSRSGHLHRLRPFNANAHFQNGVGKFCNAPPNPEHPPASTPVIGCSSDVDATLFDYGCSTMAGFLMRQLNRLQSVFHAAARLVYLTRRSEHVSPLLRYIHWLRVPQRIEFRLAVLTCRCLNGTASRYLADGLRRVADISSRSLLRSVSTALLEVPRRSTAPSVIGPSPSLPQWLGTVYRHR